ncbi:MAG: hypothetical protein RR458_05550, partial [Clostridia bacterium]
MLVAFIVLYIVAIIAFFCFKSANRSILKILSYSCLIATLVVFYIYWVKAGGFIKSQQRILFGGDYLINITSALYVKTNTLAIILSASRLLFPLFILMDAINVNYRTKEFFMKRKYLYALLALPVVACFVVTIPELFIELFAYKIEEQAWVVLLINMTIGLYLCATIALYVIELFDISLSWYKKRHKYLMASMLATIVQFIYFMGFEPVTVFQDYSKIYYISRFLRYSNTESITMWIVILAICILTTLLAMWQLYKYARFDYDRNKQELVISKAISGASVSISTIVHGVKNQIIASKILSENAMDALNEDNKEEAVKMVGKLQKINDIILTRMDYLYKSFKTMKTVMGLAKVADIIDAVKAKVGSLIPPNQITYNVIDEYVIADVELLS